MEKTAMSIIEITSIVKRYIGDIEKLKTNIKSQKEMYDSSFENDAKYSEASEKAKQASREVQAIKLNVAENYVKHNHLSPIYRDLKFLRQLSLRIAHAMRIDLPEEDDD